MKRIIVNILSSFLMIALLSSCSLLTGSKASIYELKPLMTAEERSSVVDSVPHSYAKNSDGELDFDKPLTKINSPGVKRKSVGDSFADGTAPLVDPLGSLTGIRSTQKRTETSNDLINYLRTIENSPTVSKAKRNRIIAFLVLRSDELVNQHHKVIMASSAGGNLALGNLAALSSGASAALTATSTKTALAAASTFFQTSRGLLNQEVFFGILAGKIIETIAKERTRYLNNIKTKMEAVDGAFDIAQAIIMVEQYHNAGSFQKGLIDLVNGERRKTTLELIAEYNALGELGENPGIEARREAIKKQLAEVD